MSGICLPRDTMENFKKALVSGKLTPEHLANISSEDRHALFKEIGGSEKEAHWINSQFETKMLLKNKQQGYLTWAKNLVGVKPAVKRDLISRISRMDERLLNPANEKVFLKDLAEAKLGVGVSSDEAKQIANMSAKVQELETRRLADGTFSNPADREAYGYAKTDLGTYLADLKNAAEKQSVKEQLSHPLQTVNKTASLSKAIKASLDDSAIFRQGWKTMMTNPVVWQKNARKSFSDLTRQFAGKDVMREVKADIVSRPNFDKYEKMKLAVGNVEEEFPTSLPEKIPLLGRAYKASESAYTAFLYRQRADIADKMLDIAERSGVNINDKAQLQSIGKMINALTGRGDLGRLEGTAADAMNNVFFSARFLKSNIDLLTAHQLQKNVTPFVRKQAAKNLVKVVMGTAAVMGIANAVRPGSVELDPRSKDFGKIKVGHTRFDITGGVNSLVTLAAQVLSQSTKSTSTGIVTKLNTGYGSQTGVDTVNNFFENKLSPAASFVKDMIKQQDFNGNKPTAKEELANLFVPLPIQTGFSTKSKINPNGDPHGANQLLISIADGLGIATSTYGGSSKKFAMSTGKTMNDFKQKVGDAKFRQANKDYNAAVDNWMAAHQKELNALPNDEQQSTLSTVKSKIQNQIYKNYDFKPPKSSKPSGGKKSLLDSVK